MNLNSDKFRIQFPLEDNKKILEGEYFSGVLFSPIKNTNISSGEVILNENNTEEFFEKAISFEEDDISNLINREVENKNILLEFPNNVVKEHLVCFGVLDNELITYNLNLDYLLILFEVLNKMLNEKDKKELVDKILSFKLKKGDCK